MKASKRKISALLLLGPTGTGKTPLGSCFEQYGMHGQTCFHFDFGHELRTVAGLELPPQGFSREEHAFIKEVLSRGLLLENEHFHIAGKIICSFRERNRFNEGDILVLNGLPRHSDQAKDMADIVNVGAVIALECTAEDIVKRIEANTGGDRAGRTDDKIAMVHKKLKIFYERTAPLIDFYVQAGSRVVRTRVSATSGVDRLYREILQSIVASDMETIFG